MEEKRKTRVRRKKVEVEEVTEEKYPKPTYSKKKKVEVEKEKKVIVIEEKKVEVEKKKVIEEKKKTERFVATYIGPQNNIRLSPCVGRITRGVPFKVDKDMAHTLQLDSNFKVKKI